jgi:hypothetical protein
VSAWLNTPFGIVSVVVLAAFGATAVGIFAADYALPLLLNAVFSLGELLVDMYRKR